MLHFLLLPLAAALALADKSTAHAEEPPAPPKTPTFFQLGGADGVALPTYQGRYLTNDSTGLKVTFEAALTEPEKTILLGPDGKRSETTTTAGGKHTFVFNVPRDGIYALSAVVERPASEKIPAVSSSNADPVVVQVRSVAPSIAAIDPSTLTGSRNAPYSSPFDLTVKIQSTRRPSKARFSA